MNCELCEKQSEDILKIRLQIAGVVSKFASKGFVICEINLCENCYSKAQRVSPVTLLDDEAKKTILNRLKKNFLVMELEDEERSY